MRNYTPVKNKAIKPGKTHKFHSEGTPKVHHEMLSRAHGQIPVKIRGKKAKGA